MVININHHHYFHFLSDEQLNRIEQKVDKMNEDIKNFSDNLNASLDAITTGIGNIAADIDKLLTASTTLSEEDKAALTAIMGRVSSLQASVNEVDAKVPNA